MNEAYLIFLSLCLILAFVLTFLDLLLNLSFDFVDFENLNFGLFENLMIEFGNLMLGFGDLIVFDMNLLYLIYLIFDLIDFDLFDFVNFDFGNFVYFEFEYYYYLNLYYLIYLILMNVYDKNHYYLFLFYFIFSEEYFYYLN